MNLQIDESAKLPYGHPDLPSDFRDSVDLAVLADYESMQVAGEPDLIIELIDLYFADAPRRLAGMRTSLAQQDWLTLKREAHSLRGSSGSLGALHVPTICQTIEGLPAEPSASILNSLITVLEQELERVLDLLTADRQRRVL